MFQSQAVIKGSIITKQKKDHGVRAHYLLFVHTDAQLVTANCAQFATSVHLFWVVLAFDAKECDDQQCHQAASTSL